MSLFRCAECGCVENTALAGFWLDQRLCSECNPEIGHWHGQFEKRSASGMLLGNDGFLYYKCEVHTEWFARRAAVQGLRIVEEIP